MKRKISLFLVVFMAVGLLVFPVLRINVAAGYYDVGGSYVRTGVEAQDWETNKSDLEWRSSKEYKYYYNQTEKYKKLEGKLAEYNEKHKFDSLTKAKVEKTKNVIEASKTTIISIYSIYNNYKDSNNGADFDTRELADNLIDSISSIANCFVPYGTAVSAVLQAGKAVAYTLMGGSEPNSELAQFEARLDKQFEDLNRELSTLESQISSLSSEINDVADRTIDAITDKIDKTVASEHVREFQNRGNGNFSYKEFRNYLYGTDDKGYCKLLADTQKGQHGSEDVKYYYDLVFANLYDNTDIFYDYLLPTDGKSIIQDYYDVLSSKPEMEDGEAEYQAILYAYDLYQSALTADKQLLSCGLYQYSCIYKDWYESNYSRKDFDINSFDENSSALKYQYGQNEYFSLQQINALEERIGQREQALVKQLVKDLVYILSLQDSYVVKSNNQFYEIRDLSKGSFGNVSIGQTVYLSMLPDSLYAVFGDLDRGDFSYSYSINSIVKETDTNGIFTVYQDGSFTVNFMYQNTELLYAIPFCSNAVNASFNGGDGSEYAPYLISNKEQFKAIGNDLSKHYRLIENIKLSGDEIYSFGYRVDDKGYVFYDEFTGTLDGDGYAIQNLNISGGKFAGLFCEIGDSGKIENLIIENVKITAMDGLKADPASDSFYAGVIAGKNVGQITNCQIVNCNVNYDIKNTLSGSDSSTSIRVYVGGVAGLNSNLISSCQIGATVDAKLNHNFGGNSTSENKIYTYAGGICGQNTGEIVYTLVLSNTSVSSDAHADLDPSNIVNPYIESYAGILCGINKGSIHNVCSEDGSRASATATHPEKSDGELGLGWNIGDKNVRTSIENDANGFFAPSGIFSIDYGFNSETSKILLAQLKKNAADFEWDYDAGKNVSYVVTENAFHTDGLNIYYLDSGSRIKVEDYSIISIYGWNPKNRSMSQDNQIATVLFVAVIDDTNYIRIINIPVTIEANTVKVYASNLPDSVDQGRFYSFEGASFTWDYAVGTDVEETINSINANRITISGTFTDKLGVVTDSITAISSTNVGKYILDIFYDGQLVADDFEISVICTNTLKGTPERFDLDESKSVDATCISTGEAHYVCKDCGEFHEIIEYTTKGDHSFVKIKSESQNATCSSDGVLVEKCLHCDKIRTTVLPRLAHDYKENDPSKHTCSLCGKVESHQYVVTQSVENGVLTYHYHCTSCGFKSDVADTNIKPAGADKIPMVYVSDGYALHLGDEVKVYIQLQNNPGVSGAVFGVRYDKRLIFVNKEEGDVFTDSLNNDSRNNDEINYGFNFIWNEPKGEYTYNKGNLVVLTFRLPDSIEDDEDTAFKIEVTYGDILQANGGNTICGFLCQDSVTRRFYTKAGYIRIVDHLPGDVNNDGKGDGKVDLYDAILIQKSLIDGITVIDCRYGNVDASPDHVQLPDVQRILQSLRGANSLIATDYDVTLIPNDGDDSEKVIHVYLYDSYDNSKHTFEQGEYKDLPDLTGKRPGYTFKGWYTRIERGQKVANGYPIVYDQDQWIQTLYARWEINTVTYFDGDTKLAEYEYGNVESYSSEAFIRNFYILLKNDNHYESDEDDFANLIVSKKIGYWKTADGQKYDKTIDLTESSLELYAVWEYSIKFNNKDITLGDLMNVKLQKANGYRINSLYTADDLAVGVQSVQDIFDRCTDNNGYRLYAKTELIKFTIYYKANGGVPASDQSETNLTMQSSGNLPTTLFTPPTGHHFLKWVLNTDDSKKYSTYNEVFEEVEYNKTSGRFEVTLKAKWEENIYTVSGASSNGTVYWSTDCISTTGGSQTLQAKYGTTIHYRIDANTGYTRPTTYYGSLTLNENNFNLTEGDPNTAEKKQKFSACTANTYTLKYNLNSGGILDNTEATGVYSGHNLTINYTYADRTYTLINSASSDPFATIFQTVYLEEGKTYYAHMTLSVSQTNAVQMFYAIGGAYAEENSMRFHGDNTNQFSVSVTGEYTIRFDNDTGNIVKITNFWITEVNLNEKTTVTYNNSMNTIKVPQRMNYVFSGYYDAPTGGNMYIKANGSSNRKYQITNDITLYAHWNEISGGYTYVRNATDLSNIRNNTSGKFLIVCDIPSVGAWTPISTFSGTLDGNGHTISNISYVIEKSDDGNCYKYGVFQTLTGTVQNITFTDLKVEIYKYRDGLVSLYVGGVCAELKNGTIENCHINGSSSIKGDHYREVEGGDPVNTSVGGFVGKLLSGGNIINCSIDSGSVYSKADCGKHNGNCQAYAGGMVGYQETNSLIENCSRNDGVSVNSVVRGDPSTWWGKSGHLYAYSGGIVGCYNPAATWGEIEIPATRTNCDSTATNVSAQKSQESGWCTDRIYLYKGAIGNAPKLL